MQESIIRLRGHHCISLLDFYEKHKTSPEGIVTSSNTSTVKKYTLEDELRSKEFYSFLINNPNQKVALIAEIDDRCTTCSNNPTKEKCALYREKDLRKEDKRTIKAFFPELQFGKIYTITELIKAYVPYQF